MQITPDENNTVFQLAADFVNQTSEHLFLTGKAGTGKTTFLRHIRKHTHKNVIVAAPTGVAAINAGGTTLHSLFQLPFEPFIPGKSTISKNMLFRFSKQKLDMIRQLELLIIDEVSMLRADVLDLIDAVLRALRRNPNPFGGVQVLYIGDVFQLPPVAKEPEWALLKEHYTSTFFFHAHAFRKTNPVYLELKTVYRQGDPVFVNLLNRVRNNASTSEDLEMLNRCYNPKFKPGKEDEYIILTTHNYKADQINNANLEELSGKEQVFSGKIEGEFPDYSLPTDLNLRIKPGAQVMFLRNDSEDPRRYYNGKIATVSRIVADMIYVYISDIDEEILVKKESWENTRYYLDKENGDIKEELLGSFSQYPLRLAWAITIHKSQGLTFDRAIIDAGASFAAGQTYVALSRCTSLNGIVLYSQIRHNSIMTDPHALEFSRNERDASSLQALFNQGRRRFWAERLLMYFDWTTMYQLMKRIEKLLQEKDGKEYQTLHRLLPGFREKVYALDKTTGRFHQELNEIIQEPDETRCLTHLKDRCTKAVSYFQQETIREILQPLQSYIHTFKRTPKTRTFYKNLVIVEEDMILFLENMKKARYNNIPLIESDALIIPRRKELFEEE